MPNGWITTSLLRLTVDKIEPHNNDKLLLPQQSGHAAATAVTIPAIPSNPPPLASSCDVVLLTTLLPPACFAFMLYSSFTAIWQSRGDPSTVLFVASSLAVLGLLYLAMREFERAVAANDHRRRNRLKMAVLALAIALNVIFSIRVTSVLQSPVMSAMVWAIAAATSLIGSCLFLFLPNGVEPGVASSLVDDTNIDNAIDIAEQNALLLKSLF